MSGDNLNDPSIPHDFNAYGAEQVASNPNFENGDFAPLVDDMTPQVDLEACWEKVSARMRIDLGDAAWRSWIKPLRVGALHNNMLTIEADSSLARDRVNSQYADRLRVISAAEFSGV
ncbi:DnaA N-terminal domain-containing protein, partial [Candidatus Puniceispirillum sp.]|uniref:DnaA N-terminal domain-containing protein n=1 Tax=Candidatus Puniceispirillum sp. TaxID=2026719 RepID=UPI003F6A0297